MIACPKCLSKVDLYKQVFSNGMVHCRGVCIKCKWAGYISKELVYIDELKEWKTKAKVKDKYKQFLLFPVPKKEHASVNPRPYLDEECPL